MNAEKRHKLDVRRIYKAGTKTLLFRILGVALLFALHVLLGNVLGPEQYGFYSFVLSVAGILTSIAALGLPTALTRFVVQYKEQQKLEELKGALNQIPILALSASFLLSALVIIVVILFLYDQPWATALEYSAYLLPVFVLGNIRRQLYIAYAKPIASFVPDEIMRPIMFGACVWLLQLESGTSVIRWFIVITVVLSVIFLAWLYRDVRRPLSKRIAKYETKAWFVTAMPMAFSGIGYLVMNRTDVIMLGILEEMRVVGIYAAANRIAMLSQLVLATSAVIVVPMITAAYHGGRMYEFKKILDHSRIWVVTLTLPLYLAMITIPQLLLGMFGSDFMESSSLLRILATGQLVNAAAGPVGVALSMTGREKLVAVTYVLAAALNVVLNLIAIPVWGAIGAATVTMLCLLTVNIILFVVIHRSITLALRSTSDT